MKIVSLESHRKFNESCLINDLLPSYTNIYINIYFVLAAEMWFGILFAILLRLLPSSVHASSIAVFLFVMNNVGGNAPVLIEPLRGVLPSYRSALIVMYPGSYLASELFTYLTRKLFTYITRKLCILGPT